MPTSQLSRQDLVHSALTLIRKLIDTGKRCDRELHNLPALRSASDLRASVKKLLRLRRFTKIRPECEWRDSRFGAREDLTRCTPVRRAAFSRKPSSTQRIDL